MEHSALVAEIPFVERMPLSDRLRHAKKRRAQQLKAHTQREKRLVKEASLTGKRSGKRGSDTTTPSDDAGHQSRLQFVDGVLMMEAVVRNDTSEGGCCLLSVFFYSLFLFTVTQYLEVFHLFAMAAGPKVQFSSILRLCNVNNVILSYLVKFSQRC